MFGTYTPKSTLLSGLSSPREGYSVPPASLELVLIVVCLSLGVWVIPISTYSPSGSITVTFRARCRSSTTSTFSHPAPLAALRLNTLCLSRGCGGCFSTRGSSPPSRPRDLCVSEDGGLALVLVPVSGIRVEHIIRKRFLLGGDPVPAYCHMSKENTAVREAES